MDNVTSRRSERRFPHGQLAQLPWDLIPSLVCGTLSLRGLNPIKLAYSPSQPDGRLYEQPAPLTDWDSMPAILVTGPAITQNSPFLP